MPLRPTLTTERLVLRPLTQSDAADVFRLVNDPEIARNTLLIPHPYPEGLAEEWIASHEERFEKNQEVVFAITSRETGSLLGVIGIIPEPHDQASLGYWIAKELWNRGYATEAAAAAIAYAFETLGVNRVEAIHYTRNPSSGRVMQKCGMHLEGTLRQARKKGDEYVDVRVYSILRSEWQASNSESRHVSPTSS
jgi:ribosomal-protein-alanine N-acetyltransferase